MNHKDAMSIAEWLHACLEVACEFPPININIQRGGLSPYASPFCVIAGGLRRGSADVHDIEIVAKPILKAPRPAFGEPMHKTELDKILAQLEKDGYLRFLMGKDKLKKYEIHLQAFGLDPALYPNGFKVEFYLVTPPAQFGVDLMIRTGPGKEDDNFSKWIVTSKSHGGALPDGHRVKHAAVWKERQLDDKGEPLKGEEPITMHDEEEFFRFLGLPWIEPKNRHAMWRKNGR